MLGELRSTEMDMAHSKSSLAATSLKLRRHVTFNCLQLPKACLKLQLSKACHVTPTATRPATVSQTARPRDPQPSLKLRRREDDLVLMLHRFELLEGQHKKLLGNIASASEGSNHHAVRVQA